MFAFFCSCGTGRRGGNGNYFCCFFCASPTKMQQQQQLERVTERRKYRVRERASERAHIGFVGVGRIVSTVV